MISVRKPHPSDVSDDEWALVARPIWHYCGGCWPAAISAAGVVQRRALCGPPWHSQAGHAERLAAVVGRLPAAGAALAGRKAEPSAAILDSRTLHCSPESGQRAGYDGAKRKRGSKLHLAVDTLGYLLALSVRPPALLPTYTSSPASASCSAKPLNWPQVHNTLWYLAGWTTR
jgi:Transposase DDE domain